MLLRALKKTKNRSWTATYFGRKRYVKVLRRSMDGSLPRANNIPYTSPAITALATSSTASKNTYHKNTLRVIMPSVFSIIDNPAESIAIISSFTNDVRHKRIREVVFDHSNVSRMDLSAEAILGVLAGELRREQRQKRKKVAAKGLYPRSLDAKRIIKSVGVVKNLDVKHEYLGEEEISTLRIFSRSRPVSADAHISSSANAKELATRDLVNHVNDCLGDHGRELTQEAIQELIMYAGEILDNAEEHAGTRNWFIVGYLDNTTSYHNCEIVMFNYGRTIAQTFHELPHDAYMRQVVSPYMDIHMSQGWFGPGWHKDDLLTLVALQGQISCKNDSPESDRGQGTVDLIEFFQQVHKECTPSRGSGARMAIVSGSSYMLFDGKYAMQPDDKGRDVIAFNSANDLRSRPDKKYVKNMGEVHFPGTIIAIKFPLGIDHRTRKVKNEQ